MNAPARVKVAPIQAFRARCEARALLVAFGELDLHDAVDKLQADAVRDGLVDEIGQDAVQAMMAEAFRIVPPEARPRQGPPEPAEDSPARQDISVPDATVEALVYGLRRGLSCLADNGNRLRLQRCDAAAMRQIASRLLTMGERTAGCHESWAQADVAKLITLWKSLRRGA